MQSPTLDRVNNDQILWNIRQDIRTFTSWKHVPKEYGWRDQWHKRSRKVRPKEVPQARWVTIEPDQGDDFFGTKEVFCQDADIKLFIDREVPLYHIDQTDPANFTPRTIAYLAYEEIFFEQSDKEQYIWWDIEKANNRTGLPGEWSTVTADTDAAQWEEKRLLTRAMIRRHVNQREIFGIRATDRTKFIAIDHDFHGNDRQVFLDQAEVLLGAFHGWGTWHQQVRRDDVSGMHYICTFAGFQDLDKVTNALRSALGRLDQQNPELAERARGNGMPTLADLEIYPRITKGFRLPLCRGYTMMLDRPLPLVTWRRKTAQDVVSYTNWLQNPERQFMAKEAILDHLWQNLGSGKSPSKAETTTGSNIAKGSGMGCSRLGSLKGCCRKKLTEFFQGTFNPPGSLNDVLIVAARILFFEGVSQDRAVELLTQYISDLPPTARKCSKRLAPGRFALVEKDILRDVTAAYDGNSGQKKIEESNEKLKLTVERWSRIGFRLSDKATWAKGLAKTSVEQIAWTEDDRKAIEAYLGPVLKKGKQRAVEVAEGMVNLAAVQYASENGMSYGYWQSFLEDNYDIACGNRNKIRAILEAAAKLGLIEVHSKYMRGFATVYRPGKRVADRVVWHHQAAESGEGHTGRPTGHN